MQRAVLRVEAADRDLLVSAGTGSGKTVAFGLMLARRLIGAGGRMPWAAGPRAIVVVPTRELAMQVRDELAWLFAGSGARIGCCTGGSDLRAERAALAAGLDIVVGTPGRLGGPSAARGARTGQVRLRGARRGGPDAGRGLPRPSSRRCWRALPAGRQTLMFSATVSAGGRGSWRGGSSATRCGSTCGAARGFELQGVAVAPGGPGGGGRQPAAAARGAGGDRLLRPAGVGGALAERLAARGFAVAALSGALSQAGRNAALAALREGRARVCVATDLAARGFDLPGLDLVLHAELPGSAEMLLHRSGRTGRAGRGGLAVLVVTPARAAAGGGAGGAGGADASPGCRRRTGATVAGARPRADAGRGGGPSRRPRRRRWRRGCWRRMAPERIAAAYRRLWASVRPAPGALTGGGRLPLAPAARSRFAPQAMRYSAWAIVRNALTGDRGWAPVWRDPEPKAGL